MIRIHSFDLGQWLRALRPFLCRCGHARSAHASGRGHCSRCPGCAAPVRITKWNAMLIGYRLGMEAERMFGTRQTTRVEILDAPTERLADLSWMVPDYAQRLRELARLEQLATDGDDPDWVDSSAVDWRPGALSGCCGAELYGQGRCTSCAQVDQ